MVKECIDFINSHPKLLKILETKRNELSEEWNKNYTGKHLLTPETQVYFGISGIEESLINNKWVPSTDSFLDIGVGPISILGVR